MTNPLPPDLEQQLERTAPRARRLLGAGVGGLEATEASGARRGPPDAADVRAIAGRLHAATRIAQGGSLQGRQPGPEAMALADTLVERAGAAMAKLLGGGSNSALGTDDLLGLEAVMQVRGRPVLRVEAAGLEGLDPVKFPQSDFWRPLLDDHSSMLFAVAGATGAVRVHDIDGRRTWVQGSAWLAGPSCVITNRHVLFPPDAMALARRQPGAATKARFKPDLQVSIDLAFDNGAPRGQALSAIEVLYVAEERDPVDVALIRVAPLPGVILPEPLALAGEAFERSRLYVVGHPGRLDAAAVSEKIQAAFGSPDERKRISLGELMDADPSSPNDLVHDASTIGGYSGGCVLGFLTREVAGLHYYGDPESGNRAILSTTLREHPVARFLG